MKPMLSHLRVAFFAAALMSGLGASPALAQQTEFIVAVLPFTAPVTDANASLEIDLGRSDETTWIDTVSFRPATGP